VRDDEHPLLPPGEQPVSYTAGPDRAAFG
jgi:hypothetical protein